MGRALLFLLWAIGGCCFGNGTRGLVVPSEVTTGRTESAKTAAILIATSLGREGKQPAATSRPTRAPLDTFSPHVIEHTTPYGVGRSTTEKQTSPADHTPSASILAISLSICLLFLLFGGILITTCLVIRSKKLKRNSEKNCEAGEEGYQKSGSWRDRFASHIHQKRRDTRCNADDNHPYVVYTVREGHAQSFGKSTSFAELSTSVNIEPVEFRDDEKILTSFRALEHTGHDAIDSVRGFENIGYLPESPQVSAKKSSSGTSPREGAFQEFTTERANSQTSADEDLDRNTPGLPSYETNSGSLYLPVTDLTNDSPPCKYNLPKEIVKTVAADDPVHRDNISVSSIDSSDSSVCGFWAPNVEVIDRGESSVQEDNHQDLNSDKDHALDDGEPPYSTWPLRKTSEQVSEVGSDFSVIEPTGSDEEEDPYDVITPGESDGTTDKKVKPVIECISELQGQFSDGDEESPYDTLPQVSAVEDHGACEENDCTTCGHDNKEQQHIGGSGRVSPYDMAAECEWNSVDLAKCQLCPDSSASTCSFHPKVAGEGAEESPYDTLPLGRPKSVECVDEIGDTLETSDHDVKKRHPTYTTIPDDVLGPYYKERVETFFVEDISSSSEESLADEDDVAMDTRKMSLEISDLDDEDEGQSSRS